ncbi:hypothetical protein DY000_02054692 [Brassica cretica]|uniref:Serine aminopeptidase S33 domain-containing protein n=1 Tax=Brassica cretica TaxID=69181 RepID=A0ABQ7ALS4_BRACR|nr:hypothetical protein DY000_02054692 [Brassica cretica]
MSDHDLSPEINFWGDTPEQDYFNLKGITGSKSYFKSPRGLNLFTRSWLPSPSSSPPRGIIFMVHGYGNDISWTFQSTAIFLAQNGFACFALDIEGHGRSDGVRAYVPSVDLVVHDLISFFDSIKKQPKYQTLPRFLFGESMGGAISLLIHFLDPSGFDGAVLVAPMCKISDKCIKVEEKKPIAKRNPMRYGGKPRLGTVMELLRVTDYLGKKLKDVSVPFLVLHGSADVVTDPEVSRELYESAKSEDKTLKIYDGMMHSMLFGETDENVEIVRGDIVCWLNDRCGGDRT